VNRPGRLHDNSASPSRPTQFAYRINRRAFGFKLPALCEGSSRTQLGGQAPGRHLVWFRPGPYLRSKQAPGALDVAPSATETWALWERERPLRFLAQPRPALRCVRFAAGAAPTRGSCTAATLISGIAPARKNTSRRQCRSRSRKSSVTFKRFFAGWLAAAI